MMDDHTKRDKEIVHLSDEHIEIPFYKTVINGENAIVFEKFDVSNLLFHYTTIETLKKILAKSNGQLRLNPSCYSDDPVEKRGILSDEGRGKVINQNLSQNVKFICFCKPYLQIGSDKIPGYALSRMWNQYGDDYSGVCLGFNASKLKDLFNEQFSEKCRVDDIVYDLSMDPEFNVSVVHKVYTSESTGKVFFEKGNAKPWSETMIKELFFSDFYNLICHKTFDYRDENEIRFSIYDESKNDVFITNVLSALECIVFGPYVESIKAEEFDSKVYADVYHLKFDPPYRFTVNCINQHFRGGLCKLYKITTRKSKNQKVNLLNKTNETG
jgi:hypothetical protein